MEFITTFLLATLTFVAIVLIILSSPEEHYPKQIHKREQKSKPSKDDFDDWMIDIMRKISSINNESTEEKALRKYKELKEVFYKDLKEKEERDKNNFISMN